MSHSLESQRFLDKIPLDKSACWHKSRRVREQEKEMAKVIFHFKAKNFSKERIKDVTMNRVSNTIDKSRVSKLIHRSNTDDSVPLPGLNQRTYFKALTTMFVMD